MSLKLDILQQLRRCRVIGVSLDPVEVNFTLMEIRVNNKLFRRQFLLIYDYVQELVALEGVDGRVHLDLLIFLQVQNIVVLVEDFIVCQIPHGLVHHQVISDFENVVIEVHVAVYEGIHVRFKDTLQFFIDYRSLEYLLVVLVQIINFEVVLLGRVDGLL